MNAKLFTFLSASVVKIAHVCLLVSKANSKLMVSLVCPKLVQILYSGRQWSQQTKRFPSRRNKETLKTDVWIDVSCFILFLTR